nr:hypothetical protein [Tanacetum cinerariifolium]
CGGVVAAVVGVGDDVDVVIAGCGCSVEGGGGEGVAAVGVDEGGSGGAGGKWGGGSYRSGHGKCLWGSPKTLAGKVFRRRWWLAVASWWPAVVAGNNREREGQHKSHGLMLGNGLGLQGSSLKLEKGQKNQEKRGRKFWAGTLCNAQCFKRRNDRDGILLENLLVGSLGLTRTNFNDCKNAHIKRKVKQRLKRLDHKVAAYPNGYDPLA